MNLVRNVSAMEQELQKLKAQNKRLLKNHREELRNRDRKEIAIVFVVAGCVMMYACVALPTRAFVLCTIIEIVNLINVEIKL
jgi:hypothetical protein